MTDIITWPERVQQLFEHQIRQWPLLRQNVAHLDAALTKTLRVEDFEILAQYNPQRRSSTTAKVDPASVRERPCKLCPDNLFPEQRGLAYGEELIILCNPYPILRRHLSIVHRSHIKQAIHGRLPLLLRLAKDLGESFFLFYNGPQCGASAPDHFHVQACAREELPLFQHLSLVETTPGLRRHQQLIHRAAGIGISCLYPYHVRVLVYRGTDPAALSTWFERTLSALAEITHAPAEPLLNLLVWHTSAHWTLCLFPRATHRPASYYDGSLIVSPASLDMAGLLVCPFQEHFEAITPEDAARIYAEVSLSPALFKPLLNTLSAL